MENQRPIVVAMEATSIISAFELMNHINGNMTTIEFDKNGFKTYTTTDSSKDSTASKKKGSSSRKREVSQFMGVFSREWLGYYKYDESIGKSYVGTVSTKEFTAIVKNIKKEILEFSVNVSEGDDLDKIHVKVPKGTGEKYIDFDTKIASVKHVDPFAKYYSNSEPIAKPFNKIFQSTCSGIRQTNCTSLKFNMNVDKETLSILLLNNGDNVISRETLSHEGKQEEVTDTIISVEVPADCWIIKVPKLSTNSCTHMYMSEDPKVPLLFKTHIGTQGFAICCIRMVK